MKLTIGLVTACVLLLPIGFSQGGRTTSLQPTELESLAAKPDIKITWSDEIGRIDSTEAHAIVTALVLEDSESPFQQMSGIRVDVSSEDITDQIYVNDSDLDNLKKDLDEIASEVEHFRNMPGQTGLRYLGSCRLRQIVPTIHMLSVAYYIAPDSSGLSLSAFKEQEFRFPHQNPSQLAFLVARAAEELKKR